jgi:VanZ family protein
LQEIISLKKIKPSFYPAAFWFIISTVLLTLPGSAFPKEDWLSRIWIDKWIHIGLFSILVFLCCWAVHIGSQKKLRSSFIAWAIAGIAYGIIMEFIQKYFIPNRSFDTGDIIADAAGSLLGFTYSVWRYIKK